MTKDNEPEVVETDSSAVVTDEDSAAELVLPEGVTLEPVPRDALTIMAEITSAKAAHKDAADMLKESLDQLRLLQAEFVETTGMSLQIDVLMSGPVASGPVARAPVPQNPDRASDDLSDAEVEELASAGDLSQPLVPGPTSVQAHNEAVGGVLIGSPEELTKSAAVRMHRAVSRGMADAERDAENNPVGIPFLG